MLLETTAIPGYHLEIQSQGILIRSVKLNELEEQQDHISLAIPRHPGLLSIQNMIKLGTSLDFGACEQQHLQDFEFLETQMLFLPSLAILQFPFGQGVQQRKLKKICASSL
jgi:hypothetical protein